MSTHGSTTVYYRGADLRLTGEVPSVQSFEAIPRFNGRGTWRMVVPRDFYDSSATGVYVRRRVDGQVGYFTSGPITGFRRVRRSDEDSMELWGHDDLGWLWRRWVSPQPPDYPPFATFAYDSALGATEDRIRHFVDRNLGPSARADRRVPGFVLAPSASIGTSRTSRGRFNVVGDFVHDIAREDGIGFRVEQTDTDPPTLRFSVFQPRDLSSAAMFSEGLGNVDDFEHFGEMAPNAVLAGGAGELTARTLVERTNSKGVQAWGRDERFVDARHAEDATQLTVEADTELADAAAGRTGVTFTVHDTEGIMFGRDYGLGDTVRVLTDVGQIVDVVREVALRLDSSGTETINVVIGTPETTAPQIPRTLQELHKVARRVRTLETR